MAWKCNVPCGLLHCCRRCWGQAHGGNLSSPQTTPVVATTSTREEQSGRRRGLVWRTEQRLPHVGAARSAAASRGCQSGCRRGHSARWWSGLLLPRAVAVVAVARGAVAMALRWG
jgi:hypothetical protein